MSRGDAHAACCGSPGYVKVGIVDPAGSEFSTVTSVQQRGGRLSLGSLTFPGLARFATP